jgi:hypothetical protein
MPVMRIIGAENLSAADLQAELARGGRLVFFEYCISFVFVTLRSPSGVYLLRAGETGLVRGLSYSVLSLVLGWWGVPWGIIYTPLTLWTNLSGGRDVTAELRTYLPGAPTELGPG